MHKAVSFLIIFIFSLFFSQCYYFNFNKKSELKNVDLRPDTLVVFEKSQLNAYGSIYRITMQGDGLITYEWLNSASYKNVMKRRASKPAVKRVINRLIADGFFELRGSYLSSDHECQQLTASQEIVTMILKAGGKSNEVRHYHGCKGFSDEEKLIKIEKYIENIFKIRKK